MDSHIWELKQYRRVQQGIHGLPHVELYTAQESTARFNGLPHVEMYAVEESTTACTWTATYGAVCSTGKDIKVYKD